MSRTDLAEVVVAPQRDWAMLNPARAFRRKPITVDEALDSSPPVAYPFHAVICAAS